MIEHTTRCHVVVPARRPSHDLDGCAMVAVADNVPSRHEPILAALNTAAPRMELDRRDSAIIVDRDSLLRRIVASSCVVATHPSRRWTTDWCGTRKEPASRLSPSTNSARSLWRGFTVHKAWGSARYSFLLSDR
jgi:hypothetical protein